MVTPEVACGFCLQSAKFVPQVLIAPRLQPSSRPTGVRGRHVCFTGLGRVLATSRLPSLPRISRLQGRFGTVIRGSGIREKGIPSTRDSFLCDATRAILGRWLLVGEDDSIAIEQRTTGYPSSSLTDRQDSSLWSGLGFTTPAGWLIEKKSVCRRT